MDVFFHLDAMMNQLCYAYTALGATPTLNAWTHFPHYAHVTPTPVTVL